MSNGSEQSGLIIISAMSRDRVIGKDGALPWSIPEEYEQFRAHVRGHPVIIGRTSYEIFGPDLLDAHMIVVSSRIHRMAGADVRPSVESAIERARSLGPRYFSAGGATIYRQTLPHADAMYLSFVDGDYDGDTRFPEFDETEWRIARTERHARYEFRIYERRTGPLLRKE